MHWQPEPLAQVFGKQLHLVRLGAFGAAHAQGKADYDLAYSVLADHLIEGREIATFIAALQSIETLRSNAERVRYRDPDPSGADIQSENATGVH